MQDLFARIAASNDLSEDVSREAVGHILAFMQAESDDPAVGQVVEGTPGAADALSGVDAVEAGSGIMALGAKLMGLGLDLTQIRSVAGDFIAYAGEHVGKDTAEQAVASVPAFAQFV